MSDKLILKDYLAILPDYMLCYIETDEFVIYGHVSLMKDNLPDEVLNSRVMKSKYEKGIQYLDVSTAD